MGRHVAIRVLCVAGILAIGAGTARAQTAADLFDPYALHDIRILINSKDLEELRAHFDENTHYPADFLWRDIRVRNISVRSRGTGSRNEIKIGLQISFDKYTDGQRFLGLSSLVLKNEWQDPALLRERMAMAFYNRMGVAAPRESWARVYVNNEYWGVYGVIEDLTADFLTRVFGEPASSAARGEKGDDSSGYLFEYHWQDRYWRGEDLGDLVAYEPFFPPVTHELDPETALYSPFQDWFREINVEDDAVWRDRVGRFMDLNEFVIFVAVEVYLSEWDGMTGNWGMNNFFVYRPRNTVLHHFIPWDRDHSLLQTSGEMGIFFRTDENVIFRRAMAYPDLRTLYLDTLAQCAQSALQDDWFASELARNAALITQAVHDDTRKQFDNDAFDAEIQALTIFAQARPGFVLQAVVHAR
jgi:hypothetical protein